MLISEIFYSDTLIERIEINFKTRLIYYVSNKYKAPPTWFTDLKVISTDLIGLHYKKLR